jgi:methylmalonyl-CoA mutase
MSYGIDRIYSPDDGRELGLQGMIDDLVQKSDFATGKDVDVKDLDSISFENSTSIAKSFLQLKTFQKKNLNW